MVFPCTDGKIQTVREACTVLQVEVIIFSWSSCGLSLIEWNLRKWILSTKSSCKGRSTKWHLYVDYGVLQKIFQTMHVRNAAWVKHYGYLTVLNWARWLKYCSFFVVKQFKPASFDFFVLFSSWLWRNKTWFLGFPVNFPASATWSGLVGRWALLLTLF